MNKGAAIGSHEMPRRLGQMKAERPPAGRTDGGTKGRGQPKVHNQTSEAAHARGGLFGDLRTGKRQERATSRQTKENPTR
jgi:hypothetical protein